MFSSRMFAALAVLATVAAVPATDRPVTDINPTILEDSYTPWFSFPLFGNLFEPFWKLFPNFADIGTRINSDDNQFQVVINAKGYAVDDLKVKVKGNFLLIEGSRESKPGDDEVFANQFFHTYSMPENSSADDVTAELTTDGFLVVTVPITSSPGDKKDRDVPIVETGKPLSKDDKEEKATTLAATNVEDDRKEPTTPSNKEDVTDKDNVIPHGDEVQN